MMKYYEIIALTPFCGEVSYNYIATESEEEMLRFGEECAINNGTEWFDEEELLENYDMTEKEYFEECDFEWREITKEEYEKEVGINV